jgi:hypothetical protein
LSGLFLVKHPAQGKTGKTSGNNSGDANLPQVKPGASETGVFAFRQLFRQTGNDSPGKIIAAARGISPLFRMGGKFPVYPFGNRKNLRAKGAEYSPAGGRQGRRTPTTSDRTSQP